MIGRRAVTAGLTLALIGISGTARASGGPPWGYTPDRVLFTWVGRVDREIVLSMRGGALREGGIDGWLPSRARVIAPLPRTNGLILVRVDDGRGYVDVIEQPNPWNGYTAQIRILDPRGGADGYRLTVYWDRDARGYGRQAPVWDPRWDDDGRGVDPRWDSRRDPRRDPRRGPRWDPQWGRGGDPDAEVRFDDRPVDRSKGAPRGESRGEPRSEPQSEPRNDPRGRSDGRQAKSREPERRGPPRLLAPDQPPDSLGIRPPGTER